MNIVKLASSSAPRERHLTLRDVQIIELLVRGEGNIQIGQVLGLKAEYVKTRIHLIFDKVGCDNRTHLAFLWLSGQHEIETEELTKRLLETELRCSNYKRDLEKLTLHVESMNMVVSETPPTIHVT